VNPFLIPPLGKKHYTEIWAEEDGIMPVDPSLHGKVRLSANQARGNVEQIDDDSLETDQVSTGPLLSRLLSTMRYEHRAPPTEEKDRTNVLANGNGESSLFGGSIGDPTDDPFLDFAMDSRLPPATSFPESSQPNWKVPSTKLDYLQMEERLKAELRYIGFLGEGEEPEYDEHWDDEVCQRLRFLQAKLKEQCIINGARKARMLQVAQERMAYQEYSTILEDLNTQVEQAYLKRNRTLGKGKKNAKRPGGAGGGSHVVGTAQGTARPAVSDQVKVLLERRKKWMDTITPVFSDDVLRVRGEGEDIFDPDIMTRLEASEREKWDEEIE
jgi:transcriptional adapter 3